EVFVTTRPDPDGPPVFSPRVAPPHAWEGTLFYLSAMALSAPELFDPQRDALPLPSEPTAPKPAATDEGCGCRVAGAEAPRAGGAALAWLALSAVTAFAGAWRRAGAPRRTRA